MRTLSTLATLLATTAMASPAGALDFDQVFRRTFGSSDLRDLGTPIFVVLGLAAVLFFWGALRIGKRRQQRMIDTYDDQLQDYSTRLRRGRR